MKHIARYVAIDGEMIGREGNQDRASDIVESGCVGTGWSGAVEIRYYNLGEIHVTRHGDKTTYDVFAS